MRMTVGAILTAACSAILIGAAATATSGTALADEAADIEKGKALAFDRRKGNCLSCHVIDGGDMAGDLGPPLIAMKARFPDREILKQQIADARIRNPASIMPPFGAHEVLTEDEIEKVVTYIHSL